MAKVKFSKELKLEKFLKSVREVDDRTTNLVGLAIKQRMLALISKGVSPIKGNDRFPAYKNPKKYPKNVRKDFPAKRARPVNLFLSGMFLRSLKLIKSSRGIIEIGFQNGLSQKKEQGHREGAGGQPRRPIIPSRSEQFSVTIQREVLKMLRAATRAAVKRGT